MAVVVMTSVVISRLSPEKGQVDAVSLMFVLPT